MDNKVLPERLQRLNRELKSEKRFGCVYATHGGHRLRVTIERVDAEPRHFVGDRDFQAKAEFYARHYSSYGTLPSQAFYRLTEKLARAIDRYNDELEMSTAGETYEAAA